MAKLNGFIRKQPGAKDTYQTAYDLVNKIKIGQTKTVSIDADSLKVFRKYVYDLGAKQGKEFTTRKMADNQLKVVCI